MSLFVRSIRQHCSIQTFWQKHEHLCRRFYGTTGGSMGLIQFPLPREELCFRQMQYVPKSSSENLAYVITTTSTSIISIGEKLLDSIESLFGGISTWFIKRTYQPSIIRKRRKHGFRRRKESVGGRRVLKRRMAKGRIRLGGC